MNNFIDIKLTVKPIYIHYVAKINNTSISQDLKPLVISYTINQSMGPQLWDSNFCPISFFRINKYLECNAKNITCSLFRIVVFIKQHKLEDKTAEDIPQILELGFIA